LKPEVSLECSQEPATGPYVEPDAFSSYLPAPCPQDLFCYYPVSPMRATCLVLVAPLDLTP